MPRGHLMRIGLVLTFASVARGGQVEPLSVERMSDLAAQVIVGRVAELHARWATEPKRIETQVTLQRVEYLKGAIAGVDDRFTLTVPGGTVGDWTLRISGAPDFALGEQWVLFLLPTYKTHPVVGLYQGAFRVVTDATGVERVLNAEGHPVRGLDAHGMIDTASTVHRVELSVLQCESAPQRSIQRLPTEVSAAISLLQFRVALQPILERSHDHSLRQAAGIREPVVFTPIGLKAAVPLDTAARNPLRGAAGAVGEIAVSRETSLLGPPEHGE